LVFEKHIEINSKC